MATKIKYTEFFLKKPTQTTKPTNQPTKNPESKHNQNKLKNPLKH